MERVLIVDDEILVRVGLRTAIDWNKNGFILVGEAQNGKEALEHYSTEDIDILITDVAMPEMDGLELIRGFMKINRKLKAVILSHHENFAFAKEAIALGVSQYILKSDLQPEKLLNILREFKTEPSNEDWPDNAKDEKYNNMKTLLDNIINDSIDCSAPLHFVNNYAYLTLFEIRNDDYNKAILTSIVESTFNSAKYEYYFLEVKKSGKYVLIFDYRAQGEDLILMKIKEFEINLRQILNKQIEFIFENQYCDIQELRKVLLNIHSNSFITKETKEINYDKCSYVIKKATKYIDEHCIENISLQNVSDYCELNASYFSYLFRKETGITYSQYLTHARVSKAETLLLKTNMKVYEITSKVGFENQYYFGKIFKEVTGLTCSEYRNKKS